jgi:hypothetical protein
MDNLEWVPTAPSQDEETRLEEATIPDHMTEYRHQPEAFRNAVSTRQYIGLFEPALEYSVQRRFGPSRALKSVGCNAVFRGEMKCSA